MKRDLNKSTICILAIVILLIAVGIYFIHVIHNTRTTAVSCLALAIKNFVSLTQKEYTTQLQGKASQTILVNGNRVCVIPGIGRPTSLPDGKGIDKLLPSIKKGFTPSYSKGEVTYNLPETKNCFVNYKAATGKVSISTKGCNGLATI